MINKILLLSLLILLSIIGYFNPTSASDVQIYQDAINENNAFNENNAPLTPVDPALQQNYDAAVQRARTDQCAGSKDCIDKTSFVISTSTFSPTTTSSTGDIKTDADKFLWTIIQKLMIALWAVAAFTMTIWTGYMIFYHWEDSMLQKWKTIFSTWVIALIVALSSYYLVNLVRFILYNP